MNEEFHSKEKSHATIPSKEKILGRDLILGMITFGGCICVYVSVSENIWYELADSKQGHNHAKFELPCSNTVQEKAKGKVFAKLNQECQLPPLYTGKKLKKKRKKESDLFMI